MREASRNDQPFHDLDFMIYDSLLFGRDILVYMNVCIARAQETFPPMQIHTAGNKAPSCTPMPVRQPSTPWQWNNVPEPAVWCACWWRWYGLEEATLQSLVSLVMSPNQGHSIHMVTYVHQPQKVLLLANQSCFTWDFWDMWGKLGEGARDSPTRLQPGNLYS